jgi:hypothetical protein
LRVLLVNHVRHRSLLATARHGDAAGRRCRLVDRGRRGRGGGARTVPTGLRGLLLTGFVPRYLRAEATGAHSVVDTEPLWWPPAKIVGRYLTPFLAVRLGLAETVVGPLREGAIPIEVELEISGRPAWSRV